MVRIKQIVVVFEVIIAKHAAIQGGCHQQEREDNRFCSPSLHRVIDTENADSTEHDERNVQTTCSIAVEVIDEKDWQSCDKPEHKDHLLFLAFPHAIIETYTSKRDGQ